MTGLLLLMALSVLSLNCNGIRDQPKRAGLVQWLRSLPVSVDIVCLQETHCLSLSECSLWFQSCGFSCALSCGSVHSCGCVVVVISIVNLCSAANRFVCVVFMRLITTLHVTSFLMIFRRRWIPRFPPSFAATSTRSSIGQLTVLVRTHLTCPMRVFPLSRIFLMPSVQLTFGGISVLLLLPFFGPGGMALVPPVLISVVFRMCGFLLFSRVISFPIFL